MKNEKYKISAEEFSKVSLTRLSNSPSSPSQYNGARLGAEDLKKRMDAPLELFRDKLNALVAFLLGEGDDSAVAHISTGIKEGHTISQMLKDIISESAEFASYLSVCEKSLLKKLEGIDLSLERMGEELGNCVDKNTYESDINAIGESIDKRVKRADGEGESLYASEGGKDKLVPISLEALPNTAVKRDALGCVKVAEPMGDSDAVPKGYVNSHFAKRGDVPTSVANALVGSEMGAVVALKDVSPIEHNLGVKVESKNLLPYPYFETTKTVNGITFTDNGDGSITMNGTCSGGRAIFYLYANAGNESIFKMNRNLMISGAHKESYSSYGYLIEFNCYNVNSGAETWLGDDGNGCLLAPEWALKNLYILVKDGAVLNNVTIYPMVESGTTKSGYTPYIADIESVKVLAQGKNLLSLDKFQNNPWNNTTLENGVFKQIKADTESNYFFKVSYVKDGKIIGLVNVYDINTPQIVVMSFTCDKTLTHLKIGVNGSSIDTIAEFDGLNIPAGTYTVSLDVTDTTQGSISWKDMQIECGTSASDYEPYKEPIEYSYGEDIKSIYPSTTLMTDTAGAVISVEYNRDINKAFEELMKIILSLGGNLYV